MCVCAGHICLCLCGCRRVYVCYQQHDPFYPDHNKHTTRTYVRTWRYMTIVHVGGARVSHSLRILSVHGCSINTSWGANAISTSRFMIVVVAAFEHASRLLACQKTFMRDQIERHGNKMRKQIIIMNKITKIFALFLITKNSFIFGDIDQLILNCLIMYLLFVLKQIFIV